VLPLLEHAKDQALTSPVAAKEVVTGVIGDNLGFESYFQQLTGFNRRAVRDPQVPGERWRVAKCIAFGNVELNRQGRTLKLGEQRRWVRLPTRARQLNYSQHYSSGLLPSM
jgi:hypothetical protein